MRAGARRRGFATLVSARLDLTAAVDQSMLRPAGASDLAQTCLGRAPGCWSGLISRVLSRASQPPATISLGRPSPAASNALPGSRDETGRLVRRLAASLLPYVDFHRTGFAVPPMSPPARWALTPPFHPCPGHGRGRPRPPGRRSVLCCTFPGLAPGGRYPPSCPAVPGLSSAPEKGPRPPGPLQRERSYRPAVRSPRFAEARAIPAGSRRDPDLALARRCRRVARTTIGVAKPRHGTLMRTRTSRWLSEARSASRHGIPMRTRTARWLPAPCAGPTS